MRTPDGTSVSPDRVTLMRLTPSPPLNAMTLPWPAKVPPMRWSSEPVTNTPSPSLESALRAFLLVPMRLPWIVARWAAMPRLMPEDVLPEIRLRSARATEPMRTSPALTRMPDESLPRSWVPVASVPMKLPMISLPSEPADSWMPRPNQ